MEFKQGRELKEFNTLYREIDGLYHNIALSLGLSDSEFNILYELCEIGDGCLQRDICKISLISKQTINSAVKKLERNKYIYLSQGKGKDKHIYLTEKGEQLMKEKIIPVMETENRVFEEMAENECSELLRITRKYLEILRQKIKG